jgi:hypothetical protein
MILLWYLGRRALPGFSEANGRFRSFSDLLGRTVHHPIERHQSEGCALESVDPGSEDEAHLQLHRAPLLEAAGSRPELDEQQSADQRTIAKTTKELHCSSPPRGTNDASLGQARRDWLHNGAYALASAAWLPSTAKIITASCGVPVALSQAAYRRFSQNGNRRSLSSPQRLLGMARAAPHRLLETPICPAGSARVRLGTLAA